MRSFFIFILSILEPKMSIMTLTVESVKKLETLKSGFGQVKIVRKFCENGCGGIVESVENLISSTEQLKTLCEMLKTR